VNEAATDGMTVLMTAAAGHHQPLATFLLASGANPRATAGASGATALHYAAAGPNLADLVKTLLARGADPNTRLARDGRGIALRDAAGATPILLAALMGNAEVVRILAAGGADPKLALNDRSTPLFLTAGNGRGRVSNYREYTEAEEKWALETVHALVALGADIDAVNDDGQTALHAAAYIGADTIIEYLASRGAKLDVMDKFGQTALSIAANLITVGLGDNFDAKPRRFRDTTINLLLKSGATPLAASGLRLVGPLPETLQH
jgi:ankyrin repeat protein